MLRVYDTTPYEGVDGMMLAILHASTLLGF